jgi:hypothetical protein
MNPAVVARCLFKTKFTELRTIGARRKWKPTAILSAVGAGRDNVEKANRVADTSQTGRTLMGGDLDGVLGGAT